MGRREMLDSLAWRGLAADRVVLDHALQVDREGRRFRAAEQNGLAGGRVEGNPVGARERWGFQARIHEKVRFTFRRWAKTLAVADAN